MTAERRLIKLEGALSPKAASLLWLAQAQEFGSLPACVEWLIDQPISADPLERVPAQARASALEAMRGQPREAVREAAHRAVRDAIFGVELVLKLNVAAEETMRLSRLHYAARRSPIGPADALRRRPARPEPTGSPASDLLRLQSPHR